MELADGIVLGAPMRNGFERDIRPCLDRLVVPAWAVVRSTSATQRRNFKRRTARVDRAKRLVGTRSPSSASGQLIGPHNGVMPEVRHTDMNMANPSTLQQRVDAAQRQADGEVADGEEVVNLRVGDKGTRMGDDCRLWWPVTYEVQ